MKPRIEFEWWSWIHQRVFRHMVRESLLWNQPWLCCYSHLSNCIQLTSHAIKIAERHCFRRSSKVNMSDGVLQSTTAIFLRKICWMRSWHRAPVFFRSWRKLRCRIDTLDNDSCALKDARTAELNSIKEWFPGIDICPKLSGYAAWGVSLDWPVSRLLLSQCSDNIQISNSILSDQFCCEKPSNSSMLCVLSHVLLNPYEGHDISWFNFLTVIGFWTEIRRSK